MKVELSIADDRELRSAIRDMIKGEIVSIARGEIRAILAEVVKEGILPKTEEDFNRIVVEEVRGIIKRELNNGNYNTPSTLSKIAREILNDTIEKMFSKGDVV